MKKNKVYDPAKPYLVSGIIVILSILAVLTVIAFGRERGANAALEEDPSLGYTQADVSVRTDTADSTGATGTGTAIADLSSSASAYQGRAGETESGAAETGGVQTVGAENGEAESAAADDRENGITHSEKWQEGYIRYKGEKYRYNPAIQTYLFMGIDKDDKIAESKDHTLGGQSDALFLIAVDDKARKISVITINRNAMTDIEVCDTKGRRVGTFVGQICLQHGYGDGMSLSCERTVRAVANLFYNIPITGYLSMNMGGLQILNDAVGGVDVTVPDDFVSEAYGISMRAGEKVHLDGKLAYRYIRQRDVNEFDSATARSRRHQAYLEGMFESLTAYVAGDNNRALDIYDAIEPYTLTDIDFTSLASDISKYGFDRESMYSLQGCTKMGDYFEEFFVDDNYLYDLIIKVFYVRV